MIYEALIIGLKEGFKLGIVWLVFYSYLALNNKKHLLKAFYSAIVVSFLLSAAVFFIQHDMILKDAISGFISVSLAVFFISSAAALYQASGVNMLYPFQGQVPVSDESGQSTYPLFLKKWAESIKHFIVFTASVIFFAPDIAGSIIFLKELSVMKQDALMTFFSALTGYLLVLMLFIVIIRYFRTVAIGGFFSLPQILLFLAIVKLLGGGIKGFAELSLMPSVQRGFMKLAHDFIHQIFVFLMVPDHPLLTITAWNFIGFFFGSSFASIASLLIFLMLPFTFIYYSLVKVPGASLFDKEGISEKTGAQKRKIKSMLLSDRRKKAVPVFLFVFLILFSWFSEKGGDAQMVYNPKPKPVVVENGVVIIPISDPSMNLMDGRLHKFTLSHDGKTIRLLIIRKAEDALSVCLDACEICPYDPEGYGQIDIDLICVYCNTPIPLESVGDAGGCNPIPLTFSVDERFVKIDIGEILKKFEAVKIIEFKEAK